MNNLRLIVVVAVAPQGTGATTTTTTTFQLCRHADELMLWPMLGLTPLGLTIGLGLELLLRKV
jgi:hypothetical protein